MRKYSLASVSDREDVDLTKYKAVITDAVSEEMPGAVVVVKNDYYTVDPTPDRGQAIRIGKKISRTGLGRYCIKIPKLFISTTIEETTEERDNSGSHKKSLGGHF